MLVLTRKVGEQIVIDNCVRVTVVSTQGGKVRLGITAPPDVTVDRKEVHDRRAQLHELPEPEYAMVGAEGEPESWLPADLGDGD